MSNVEGVIATYYSGGARYVAISQLGRTVRGLSGKTKADFAGGNARFVSYRNVFANAAVDQSADDFVRVAPGEKQSRLHEGDVIFTGSSENVEDVGMSSVVVTEPVEPLYLNSFCFALRLEDAGVLLPAFSKYLFRSDGVRSQIRRCASGVTRINVSKARFLKVRVPLPPIAAQREIAEVLDRFTAAQADLDALLESESDDRELQHARVRDRLLAGQAQVQVQGSVALSDIVEFTNGKPHERLVDPAGSVALLTARFISTRGKTVRCVNRADVLSPARRGDIAMVMSDLPNGRALARCFYVEDNEQFTANQRVCLLRVKDESCLSSRWLYHFLDRNPQLVAYDNGQDQTHLKKGQILGIRVPVIPLDAQELVAATLDQVDAAVKGLVLALQDEVEARRKRYQFYRDRLLSFDEAAA